MVRMPSSTRRCSAALLKPWAQHRQLVEICSCKRTASALQARASRNPVQLHTVALFNPTEGYGSYVVPAVALLILQQTLLMGAAMLAGTWVETGQHRASPGTWWARLLALCTLGMASGLLYFGWIFIWQDYPRGGNPWVRWCCCCCATCPPTLPWGCCWTCGQP